MGLKTTLSVIFFSIALIGLISPILTYMFITTSVIQIAPTVVCCWPISIVLILMGLSYEEKGRKDELHEKKDELHVKLMQKQLEEGDTHRIIKETEKEDPLAILKARYAKGKITKKQYDKMKKELE